jgi:hypothetical protein
LIFEGSGRKFSSRTRSARPYGRLWDSPWSGRCSGRPIAPPQSRPDNWPRERHGRRPA